MTGLEGAVVARGRKLENLTCALRATSVAVGLLVAQQAAWAQTGTVPPATGSAPGTAAAVSTAPAGTLPTMEVVAQPVESSTAQPAPYAGGQVAKGGRVGLLGNTSFMDTPFNQTSYTSQAIEDQQARSLSDLLVDDPSVRMSSARSNINEDFSIRGFTVSSQDVAFNGMYGLMPFFRVPIEAAERVEVLKGPSSLLNGMPPSGNVGGAINLVPKRAADEPLNQLSTSYTSDSIFGVQADVGRRFGANKEWGIRFNGNYADGDSAIDGQSLRDQLGTVALDYRGEKLRASLDVLYQSEKIDPVVRQFQAGPALTVMPAAPDPSANFPGYGRSDTKDKMVVAHAEYDVSDALTVYGGAGTRHHTMDALAGNITLLDTAGDFVSSPAWQIFKVDSQSYEAGADLRFATGGVKHKLAMNVSRVTQNQDIFFDFTSWQPRMSNIFHPTYSETPSVAGIDAETVNYNDTTLTSYAVADTMSFLDDRVKVTLGARHQNVDTQAYDFVTGAAQGDRYDASKVTPVAGVVYQPMKNLSFYANYIEGLSQGPVAPIGTLNQGTVFDPIQTKQKEIGTKVDWGTFATTLSLFEIERPSAFLSNGFYGLNGEQRNRGAEVSLFGEVARDVRLLGGVTLMQGELTQTANGAFDGNDAIAVPHVQANLGLDWDNVLAPGLGFNARVIYTGAQYADQANLLRLPAWTRFDVGARYRTRVNNTPLTLRANVENLFDKGYWASSNEGYLYVGAPRTFLLTATVAF